MVSMQDDGLNNTFYQRIFSGKKQNDRFAGVEHQLRLVQGVRSGTLARIVDSLV